MARDPEKAKARHARYRAKHKTKVEAKSRAWYLQNREKMVAYRRKRDTGFTAEMFASRLEAQNNKCAICHKDLTKDPCADHCHETGKQRGILCRQCNAMLGHAKDNPEILQRAIEYLSVWS